MFLNLEEELGNVSLKPVTPITTSTNDNNSNQSIDSHVDVLKNAVLNHRKKIERGETVVENIDEKLMESKVGQGFMIFASSHSPSLDYSNKNNETKRIMKTESLDLSQNDFISSNGSPRNNNKHSTASNLVFSHNNGKQSPINETTYDYNDGDVHNGTKVENNKTLIFSANKNNDLFNTRIIRNEVNVDPPVKGCILPDDSSNTLITTSNEAYQSNINQTTNNKPSNQTKSEDDDKIFTGNRPKSMFFTPSKVFSSDNKDKKQHTKPQTTVKTSDISEKSETHSINISSNSTYLSNSDKDTKPYKNGLSETAPKRSDKMEQRSNNDDINARLQDGNFRLKEVKKDQNKKGTLYFSSEK